jgi:hypothetical protein
MAEQRGTVSRGYGPAHKAERAKWVEAVATGEVWCSRQGPKCIGKPIAPGQDWDLGHDDHDRSKYTGPECVPCNRGTGGRNGAAVTNAKHSMTIRDW